MWSRRRDHASAVVAEDGCLAASAGVDVVVVQPLVVSRAEQDQVRELGPAAGLGGHDVVCLEVAAIGAARVLAVFGASV
jgi:hypothetical protein